ncbi:hypothetical protein B0O99DRAFT_305261 [Bisporella sp. PMI_857]|nr:hypothetical protein B0O99DRAFT_305261 [Bisporella sp. PMI_857]
MRFNIAILFALTATTQLTAAVPAPVADALPAGTKWNDKGPEAAYKFGAVACTLGAYVCNQMGQPLGQHAFVSTGICCSTAAAAVTASQSEGWVNAAKKVGKAAVIAKNGVDYAGRYTAYCTVEFCKMVAKKVGGRDEIGGSFPEQDKTEGNLAARFAETDLLLD